VCQHTGKMASTTLIPQPSVVLCLMSRLLTPETIGWIRAIPRDMAITETVEIQTHQVNGDLALMLQNHRQASRWQDSSRERPTSCTFACERPASRHFCLRTTSCQPSSSGRDLIATDYRHPPSTTGCLVGCGGGGCLASSMNDDDAGGARLA
jgi:hypothetical protein